MGVRDGGVGGSRRCPSGNSSLEWLLSSSSVLGSLCVGWKTYKMQSLQREDDKTEWPQPIHRTPAEGLGSHRTRGRLNPNKVHQNLPPVQNLDQGTAGLFYGWISDRYWGRGPQGCCTKEGEAQKQMEEQSRHSSSRYEKCCPVPSFSESGCCLYPPDSNPWLCLSSSRVSCYLLTTESWCMRMISSTPPTPTTTDFLWTPAPTI